MALCLGVIGVDTQKPGVLRVGEFCRLGRWLFGAFPHIFCMPSSCAFYLAFPLVGPGRHRNTKWNGVSSGTCVMFYRMFYLGFVYYKPSILFVSTSSGGDGWCVSDIDTYSSMDFRVLMVSAFGSGWLFFCFFFRTLMKSLVTSSA